MHDESIEAFLARCAHLANHRLSLLVPGEDVPPATIHRAMRYSLLSGGKRVRPALVIAAGEALGADAESLLTAASAVEMIHTYSLIHDDLPAMDDDDLRRGRPTCHKVFGEAIAILAGDALLTCAFEVLCRPDAAPDAQRRLDLVRELATAAGTVDALVGGQVADLENEGRVPDAKLVEYIHGAKTGALIRAACVMGGIAAGGSVAQVSKLRVYGQRVGLAFQIADDVLDLTATAEQLGKTPGKDVATGKATWPAVFGVEASRAQALQLADQAIAEIKDLGPSTAALEGLARFVVARVS
jgi:geranylgeranyl diphosphate synthase type II